MRHEMWVDPVEETFAWALATIDLHQVEEPSMQGSKGAVEELIVPPRLREIEQVVGRVRPALVEVLRRFRIPPDDACDLVQNVYLKYLEHADEVHTPETWMVAAMRYECLQHLRSERRKLYQAVDDALLELVSCPGAVPQERESLLSALAAKIRGLGEKCRELLRLRYRLGCDRHEIADGLGVKATSIGTLERRCLAQLSERVLGAAGGPG
jgi:RNA polymerase sigma factor (sigma-70 family)